MNRMTRPLVLTVGLAALLIGAGDVLAQGGGGRRGGNVDPAQFQQRRLDNIKQALEITKDDEWNALRPLVQKVLDAQAAVPRGMRLGGRGGGGAGGDNANGGGGSAAGGGRRRNGVGATQNPDAQALQQALDSKVSTDELKTKLAKFLETRKTNEANLAKAQDDLRKVLTVRQEVAATLMGLL